MEDIEDMEMPKRLIAAGEEPLGERVNVYQKMKTLRGLIDALSEDEKTWLRGTQFGNFLDFPNKPAFSATFGLQILSRQLDVMKSNEIWVVFAGTPVRFSLREFKIVTGLRCGKYPPVQKKRKRNTAGRKIPFYSKLFGLEEDVTVERVITMLKKKIVKPPEMRRRYAILALVDGYIAPTTHYPKIIKDHAEKSENLDFFLSYPWGRHSFEMMMTSLKERDVEQLATTCVVVQGLVYALQLVILLAAPSIQDGALSEESVGTDSDEDSGIETVERKVIPFQLGNAKEIDANCTAKIDPIICPELGLDFVTEDLTWSDDEDDPRVDNMIRLANEGFKFSNNMFQGGCVPSELEIVPKKPKRGTRGNAVRSRKTSKTRSLPSTSTHVPSRSGGASGPYSGDLDAVSRLLDEKLVAQEKRIVDAVIAWFENNVSVSSDKGLGTTEVNGANHENSNSTKQTNSPMQGRGYAFSEPLNNPAIRGHNRDDVVSSGPAFREDGVGIEAFIGGVAAQYVPNDAEYHIDQSPGHSDGKNWRSKQCCDSEAGVNVPVKTSNLEKGIGDDPLNESPGFSSSTVPITAESTAKFPIQGIGDDTNESPDLPSSNVPITVPSAAAFPFQGIGDDDTFALLSTNPAGIGDDPLHESPALPSANVPITVASATAAPSQAGIGADDPTVLLSTNVAGIGASSDEIVGGGGHSLPGDEKRDDGSGASSEEIAEGGGHSLSGDETRDDDAMSTEEHAESGGQTGSSEETSDDGNSHVENHGGESQDAISSEEIAVGGGQTGVRNETLDDVPTKGENKGVDSEDDAAGRPTDPSLLIAPVPCASGIGTQKEPTNQTTDPTESSASSVLPHVKGVPYINPECPPDPSGQVLGALVNARRSKRNRTISTKLDGRFQFDKKTKALVGYVSPLPVPPDPELRFQNSMKKLKASSSICLGGEVVLAYKDLIDLIERSKPMSNKVMDAMICFSRQLLRSDAADGFKLRVDALDSKFVGQLNRLYTKFIRTNKPETFQFPTALIDAVAGRGEPHRVQLFTEADYVYMPFNFEKKHWVAVCVDFHSTRIIVLDCNFRMVSDANLRKAIKPIAVMLPFLLKQAAVTDTMRRMLPIEFSIERSLSIPQVTSHLDSGIMAIFLLHAHATGGLEECFDFDVGSLDIEAKKLVSAIIMAGVA